MRDREYQIGIVNEKVDQYLAKLLPERDSVLKDLERDAAKRNVPIIGPLVGNLISIILSSSKPQKALEIGTATGYSGIWIARSLVGGNKKLTTIELDPERIKEAKESFKRARVSKIVEIKKGDARALVPEIVRRKKGSFDLVFLDVGDKTLYVDLLSSCIDALKVGGFLIADNTLWGGSVAATGDKSPETTTIRKFNELVFSEKRLDVAIIPLRDGFTVARKKKN